MQKKFRFFCSFPPSFLLYFFIRRVSPEGAWPAEIQPAARLLAFQLGLSAPLLCSLFDASFSFFLSLWKQCEACDEVRSSARPHFISEIESFRRRGTTSASAVKWDPTPQAARRGREDGRGRGKEGSQSVGRLSASLKRIDLSRSPNLAK